MDDLNTQPADLKSSFIRGAAWSMAMRWSIKLLGLISTVILARLLTPGDYGLVAMAMLAVGLTEVLVNFGAETNVLRKQVLDRDIIDSAWSLRLLQGCIVAVLLALCAPLAGMYFDEPRVVAIIWFIAAGVLVSSFANIGITVARKNFQFALEYRFNIYSKLLAVAVTLVAAFILKDYRALVIGIVTGYLSRVMLSYTMHPYRPAWNTTHFKAMWHFSKWLLLSGIGNYASRNTDQLIVGRIADAHMLGIYSVGSEIGQLPTAELGPPIMRAFLPTLSTIKNDMERVRAAVLKTVGAVNTLLLPTACGFAIVAEPLTLALLGDKWVEVAPFLAIFAIAGAFKVAVAPFTSLLLLQGYSRLHAQMMWGEFLAFVIVAAVLVPAFDVMGLAYARLVSVAIFFAVNLNMTKTHSGLRYRNIWKALWRPALGSAVMVGVLAWIPLPTSSIYLELAVGILVGVVVYTAFIFATWRWCGRPDGFEATLIDHVRAARKRA
jgi:O-antigen/teichoic acid export membrane protein